MAEEDNKVMVELELEKDQVSLHPAETEVNQDTEKKLEPTKRQLEKVKKERNELRRRQEKKADNSLRPKSLTEALAKELDPAEESPIKQATRYELGGMVAAPIRPPEPDTKKRPVRGQIHNLLVGFALVPLALIVLPIFGWQVAVLTALVGAVFIALGVLVRI